MFGTLLTSGQDSIPDTCSQLNFAGLQTPSWGRLLVRRAERIPPSFACVAHPSFTSPRSLRTCLPALLYAECNHEMYSINNQKAWSVSVGPSAPNSALPSLCDTCIIIYLYTMYTTYLICLFRVCFLQLECMLCFIYNTWYPVGAQ